MFEPAELLCFGGLGILIVVILNQILKIISSFIELSDRVKNLIEVTYHATHDPEFSKKLSEEINNGSKD